MIWKCPGHIVHPGLWDIACGIFRLPCFQWTVIMEIILWVWTDHGCLDLVWQKHDSRVCICFMLSNYESWNRIQFQSSKKPFISTLPMFILVSMSVHSSLSWNLFMLLMESIIRIISKVTVSKSNLFGGVNWILLRSGL